MSHVVDRHPAPNGTHPTRGVLRIKASAGHRARHLGRRSARRRRLGDELLETLRGASGRLGMALLVLGIGLAVILFAAWLRHVGG